MGHPEHDLLFIATQVARAAGLKDPASRIRDIKRAGEAADRKLAALIAGNAISPPKDAQGRAIKHNTLFFSEAETYRMLLRGHAPASEPFRKWVTEVVLPSIRKTGKFDICRWGVLWVYTNCRDQSYPPKHPGRLAGIRSTIKNTGLNP